MTQYVRVPAKVFAENASPVGENPQIGKFGNALQGIYTGEADVQEIQNSDAWSQGWTSAVVSAMNYPPLPEMNGVLKVLSYQICYLLQKGIPEWNADTVYYTNDYVNYNGKLYYSNIDNNTFEPETPGAGNSWLSGTSDVAIATDYTNGISRPDGKSITINKDGILSVQGLNNPYTLFDFKYTEYPLYNASWLLSNGQYNLASLYPTAYEALVIEQDETKNAGTSYPLPSGGNYIKRGLSVKLSTEIYTHYDFVLNTQNETFRLPIKAGINYAERYLLETGSNYRIYSDGWCEQWGTVPAGGIDLNYISTLPISYKDTNYSVGWIGLDNNDGGGISWAYSKIYPINNNTISTTRINSERGWRTWGYVANVPEQPTSFLYYYIGESIQSLSTIQAQANVILEELSKKISTDLMKAYITDTYTNGTSGYRIWTDGYCEQWGRLTTNSDTIYTVNLLKEMKDTDYLCLNSRGITGYYRQTTYAAHMNPFNLTTTSFDVYGYPSNGLNTVQWLVKGYLKEGE